MSTDTSAPQTGRSRWWLRALLIVSLALNLMFIGLGVGAAMRFGGHDGGRTPPTIGAALYRALPSEDRAAMREQMRELRRADRGESRRIEAAAIIEALGRTPFDADALAAVTGAQLNRHSGRFEAIQAAWLNRITAMNDADRAAYARRLEEIVEQKPRKRGWFSRRGD